MSSHPLNLALRFFLELVILFALGYWGWTQHTCRAPTLAVDDWPAADCCDLVGDFPGTGGPRPGARRRTGRSPARIGGAPVRGWPVWALYAAGRGSWAAIFAAVVLIHYGLSYDRIIGLLKR